MPPRPRLHVAVRLALVAACMLAAGVAAYRFSSHAGLAALRSDARHDLALLATAIDGLVTRYEQLPSAVGLSSEVLRLLRAGADAGEVLRQDANHYLEQLNDHVGGLAVFVLDTEGRVVASSDWIYSDNLLGQNQRQRAYFRAAVGGAPDRYYAIDETRNEPGYFFAHPIRDERQQWRVVGVAVVKIGLAELERRWMPRDEPVLLADANGVVIVASVPEWKFTTLRPLAGEVASEIGATRRFGDHPIRPFPVALDAADAGAPTLVSFGEAPRLAGGRRLVLKTPTNTARIPFLLEHFPDARFVHIVRSPYLVWQSMRHMYRRLLPGETLQELDWPALEGWTRAAYVRVMRRYLEDRARIPRGRLFELRFGVRHQPAVFARNQTVVGDHRAFLGEAFDVLRLFFQERLRDEQRKVSVLVTRRLEHLIERLLDVHPNGVAPRLDDHAAAHVGIFRQIGGGDHLLIPLGIVFTAGRTDCACCLLGHFGDGDWGLEVGGIGSC